MVSSDRSISLLPLVTCPTCWYRFPPEDILWVATHSSLLGDSRAGDAEYRRFLPTLFTVDGRALPGAVSQVAFEVRATSDERPVLTGRFPLAAHLVPRLTDLLLESLALATSGTLRAKHPDGLVIAHQLHQGSRTGPRPLPRARSG